LVHADLESHREETRTIEEIHTSLNAQLTIPELDEALEELMYAQRAARTFGGFSVIV
jgi:hypothetical protein